MFLFHDFIHVSDLSDAHIIITDDMDYQADIPILKLGKDIFIPTKKLILEKTIFATVQSIQTRQPLTQGNITLQPDIEVLHINNKVFTLTKKEVDIMSAFLKNKTLSRTELLQQVWGYDKIMDTHTVQTHIYRLKKKCAYNLIFTTVEGDYTLNLDIK